jgi:hypothetical protein
MGGPEIVYVEQPANWPTLVTAIAAAIGAAAAVSAVIYQGIQTRRQLGIQNMWKLVDRWDSDKLLVARVATARELLVKWPNRTDLPDASFDLLDTFELLAYLVVRSQTLSLEDAWINFSGPAIQWWHILRPGIETMWVVFDDRTQYEDYTTLVEQLMDMEATRRGKTRQELEPSDADLVAFLQEVTATLSTPERLSRLRRLWRFVRA